MEDVRSCFDYHFVCMFVFMSDKFISDRLFDNRIKEWIKH